MTMLARFQEADPLPPHVRQADEEYEWLDRQHKALRALATELERGYPRLDIPNDIDVALSRIEDALDCITRRQNALDGGDA